MYTSSNFADLAKSIGHDLTSPSAGFRLGVLEAEFPGALDTAEFNSLMTDDYELSMRSDTVRSSIEAVDEYMIFDKGRLKLPSLHSDEFECEPEQSLGPDSERLRIPRGDEFYTFRGHEFSDEDLEPSLPIRPITPPVPIRTGDLAREAVPIKGTYREDVKKALASKAEEFLKGSHFRLQRAILKSWRNETSSGERHAVFAYYHRKALSKRVIAKFKEISRSSRVARVAAAKQRYLWIKRSAFRRLYDARQASKGARVERCAAQKQVRRGFLKKILKAWLFFVRPSAQYLRDCPLKKPNVIRDVDILLRRIETSERKISQLWQNYRRKSKSVKSVGRLRKPLQPARSNING